MAPLDNLVSTNLETLFEYSISRQSVYRPRWHIVFDFFLRVLLISANRGNNFES